MPSVHLAITNMPTVQWLSAICRSHSISGPSSIFSTYWFLVWSMVLGHFRTMVEESIHHWNCGHLGTGFQIGNKSLEGVELCLKNSTLGKVCIGISILPNLTPKVANCSFYCLLGIACKGPSTDCFGGNVCEKVDALVNKMDMIFFSLVIEVLEFFNKVM